MFVLVVILCASDKDEHNILKLAQKSGMTNGEYLYITLDHLPPINIRTPWTSKDTRDDQNLVDIYKHVLEVQGCFIVVSLCSCKYVAILSAEIQLILFFFL